MTNRQIKWYNTRMLNMCNKIGLLDEEFKSISMDFTKAEPLIEIHYKDNTRSGYSYSYLKSAKWNREEERIANKGW